jgi:hypothetical protein
MRVGQQNIVNITHLFKRKVASARARVDQYLIINKKCGRFAIFSNCS